MKRAEDKVLQNFAEVAALGHTEVVKLLLADSRVNPAADDNDAIREAAFMGNRRAFKTVGSDLKLLANY